MIACAAAFALSCAAVLALAPGTAEATGCPNNLTFTPTTSASNNAQLPNATLGEAYETDIVVSGGSPTSSGYHWTYDSSQLPPGLSYTILTTNSLNDTLRISGTPTGTATGGNGNHLLGSANDNVGTSCPQGFAYYLAVGESPTSQPPGVTIPDPITVGDTVSCNEGPWQPSNDITPLTFKYTWRRTDQDGNTTDVGIGQSYTTVPADGGNTIECVVDATNKFGSTRALSNLVRVKYPPKNVLPPTLHLNGVRGSQSLECDLGEWDGAPNLHYHVHWYKDGNPVADEADVSEIPITSADEGSTFYCQVVVTNTDGVADAISNSLTVPGDFCPDPSAPAKTPRPCADLSVKTELLSMSGEVPLVVSTMSDYQWIVTVTNHGPDASETTVTVHWPPWDDGMGPTGPLGEVVEADAYPPYCAGYLPTGFLTCGAGFPGGGVVKGYTLLTGQSVTLAFRIRFVQSRLSLTLGASVSGSAKDWNSSNDRSQETVAAVGALSPGPSWLKIGSGSGTLPEKCGLSRTDSCSFNGGLYNAQPPACTTSGGSSCLASPPCQQTAQLSCQFAPSTHCINNRLICAGTGNEARDAASRRSTAKVVKLATVGGTIPGGHTGRLRVRLTSAGKRALAKQHRLTVYFVGSVRDRHGAQEIIDRRITLRS